MECTDIKRREKRGCVQKQGKETAYEQVKACQQHACNIQGKRNYSRYLKYNRAPSSFISFFFKNYVSEETDIIMAVYLLTQF